MSRVLVESPEEIYQDRFDKFMKTIRNYQDSEKDKINQKSKDEREYEANKIIKEARERDGEVFEKKQKNIEVESKIYRSRKVNEMRLSKMKLRFEMIEKVQAEVNTNLLKKISNQNQYRVLLEQLLIQGMIKLLEEKVEIKCLARDTDLVKEAATRAQKQFREICSVETVLTISHEKLPESDLGGIILTSFNGKIVCNNTLKARLEYALQLSLPDVRRMLFTESDVKK